MTWVELASIAAGLGIGYWLVSVFTHRPDDAADAEGGLPPPESDAPAGAAERPWHEVLEVSEWAPDEAVAAAIQEELAGEVEGLELLDQDLPRAHPVLEVDRQMRPVVVEEVGGEADPRHLVDLLL